MKVNLKELRNTAGMTQEELAEKVNVDRTMITKVESGKAQPSVKLAKRLAEVLNFTWSDIFED